LSDLRDTDPLLLVHNTVSTAADIEFAQANHKNLFWCLCPQANLYIENRLPDVQLLKDSGCKMVIGTDSLASNTSLNLWNEIKTLQHHFSFIPTEEALRWVTSNASEALSMQQKLGSFESGKQPGLLHIKNYKPQEGIPDHPICEWLFKS
jgi:cytosine/adenosine deaminase-related metal-dependent hydrolase